MQENVIVIGWNKFFQIWRDLMQETTYLSICIPTYNRGMSVFKNIKKLLQLPYGEIEIVISDNCSTDETQKIVKNITDSRVKYFRNFHNLGYDQNIIKCIQHSKGVFIFFLSDEDEIDLRNFKWLMSKIKEIIKKKHNITLILGAVGDFRKNPNKRVYYNPGNKLLNPGFKTLSALLFKITYLSGLILRNDILDIKKAKKYVGSSYIHLYFKGQTILQGYTLCSSRILSHINDQLDSSINYSNLEESSFNAISLPYTYPICRIVQFKFRLRMIYEFTLMNSAIQRKMIRQECFHDASFIVRSCFQHEDNFFNAIRHFIKIFSSFSNLNEIFYCPFFWIAVIIQFLLKLKNSFKLFSR